MNVIASRSQLRASFFRWALLTVPAVMLLGFLSGQFAGSGPGNPWFDGLVKPDIYPPPAAFGIVWSILYLMMGVALALICGAWGARGRGWALGFFGLQLIANLAWSPLFFALHQITQALYLIIALDLLVLITLVLFWRVRRMAGLLLLPYLAWTLFATALNFEFQRANPSADGQPDAPMTQRFEIPLHS